MLKDKAVVVKIGGSLLKDGKSYIKIAEQLKTKFSEKGTNLIVVVSAMKGITDKLIEAYNGSIGALQEVTNKCEEAAEHIGGSKLKRKVCEELIRLEATFKLAFTKDPIIKDLILSFGERISKKLLVEALTLCGVKAVSLDAIELIKTDDTHGNASIEYRDTYKRIVTSIPILLNENVVPVIEGFIGSTSHGVITTLGRGGSDYTATTIAALLGINEVYLITDMPGIMTADPKYVPSAKVVSEISYVEAIEASLYGGKRLHPRTFHPLINIYSSTVRIGSLENVGTAIVKSLDIAKRGRPKLMTYKFRLDHVYIALIGEGIHEHSVISEIISYVNKSNLNYEGFYTFKNRPSIVFLFKNELLEKALNTLHNLLLGK